MTANRKQNLKRKNLNLCRNEPNAISFFFFFKLSKINYRIDDVQFSFNCVEILYVNIKIYISYVLFFKITIILVKKCKKKKIQSLPHLMYQKKKKNVNLLFGDIEVLLCSMFQKRNFGDPSINGLHNTIPKSLSAIRRSNI